MQRPYVLIVALFVVAYVLTVLLTGEPAFLIPGAILGTIILAYAGINRWLTKKQLERHNGDTKGVLADGDDPYPAVPPFGNDDRPAGDTPEAHDEINPHDIPKWDRASRQAAEEQAREPGGTTTGNRS